MLSKEIIIEKINKLPSQLQHVIYFCRNLAKAQKIGVYLVGGFVRDMVLGVENFDLDIVVEKDGIEFAHKLSRILDASLVKHKAFGTATVTIKDGLKIDIATSRREIYLAPATLPRVYSGDIKDDLSRRDFTINAMACHIDFEKFGEFIDLFGGLEDLKNGIIRFLHQKSFIDDPTRIIRAVRFEQRFSFRIEKETLRFVKRAKGNKMLEKVSKHRLRDELILIFKEKSPYEVLKRLREIYNLTFLDKNIRLEGKLKNIFNNIEKANNWFSVNFPERRNPDTWLMYLMIFLFQFKLNVLIKFIKDYAFSESAKKRIISFKKEFKKIDKNLSNEEITAVKLHNLLNPLSYETILLSLAFSKNQKTKQRIREFFIKHHHKKLDITGEDLLSLGVNPGPQFKEIFKKIFSAKISGKIHTREQELEYAKKIIRCNRKNH